MAMLLRSVSSGTGAISNVSVAMPGSFISAVSTRCRGDSIAVMPFTNLSGDPARDYLSDGMSEELLTLLGRHDKALHNIQNNTAHTQTLNTAKHCKPLQNTGMLNQPVT